MQPATDTGARLSPPEGEGALRRQRLDWARLYFVCEGRAGGADPEALLRATLSAGAGVVQLRDRELPGELLRTAAETFSRLAENHSALFIVNDDPHLAVEAGADGVHIGQDDISPAEARGIVGPDRIVGLSTHSPEQIAAADAAPIDYISVGPIWATPTKPGRKATGLELISHAAETLKRPWFAIGGIGPENIADVVAAGAKRACVVRAIRDAADPAGVTAALCEAIAGGKPEA